jgi:hypothetical protein
MDQRLQQEYKKSLGKLTLLNTLIIHGNREYILYFTPDEKAGRCKLQATNGYDLWQEELDFEKFDAKRKITGLEGSYASYFEMLIKSVQQRHFEINIQADQNFQLTLYFQLNKGVTLKGDFEMGTPIRFTDAREYHCVYRQFMFDIYRAKDLEKVRLMQQKRQTSRGGNKKGAIEEEPYQEETADPEYGVKTRQRQNGQTNDATDF